MTCGIKKPWIERYYSWVFGNQMTTKDICWNDKMMVMTSLLEYYGSNTDIIVEVVGVVAQKHMVDSEAYDNPMSVSAAMGDLCDYPTLAREFPGFRVWGKFVFRTLELTDTPTNSANQVKVGHALDQSRSVQSRGPERTHQNNEPSWRSSRTDRRLSRQFWDD